MFRTLLAGGAAAALLIGSASVSLALELQDYDGFPVAQGDYAGYPLAHAPQDSDRLVIVNGNNHHVIYDDGVDDLFCVTRQVLVGYTAYGRPIYRRTMRCR